ncbi:serine/threonine-protein kinase [Streptomyces zagrosensis]|uniref:non-specific serine/threonine protein kinase n=1 Tax=Streptomyces zagrosensis TaxID=1042984 RepID=A0A7W9QHE0_9ACTN|nr:serine/threonine-protein kinase [Streptomyces zagrosensis]MBB5940059.1 serine/threonine protein kinase [Streptomyces zagrosensis]
MSGALEQPGEFVRRVIDDRFELAGRLGGGGMGLVWRARDMALHRDVALKEVRPPDPALAEYDPEAARTLRARVLREARALARIDHPNVVTIHHIVDSGEDGYPWIVMELVTGGSLQGRLDQGPMTPTEAARLGSGILAALRATHAVGIEHRDVKPANVLLRPDGRPVLTDFGIAAIRESTSLTATGSVIGSPDYMAPERVRGQAGGPAADFWSLGMLLYVAVEGYHPLRRENTLATLAAVLNDDVPPPLRAGPLTEVLSLLLVRDAGARPDAGTLDRMLTAASTQGATSAQHAPARAESRQAQGPETTSFRLAPPGAQPSRTPEAPGPGHSDTAHPNTAHPSDAHDARRGVGAAGPGEPADAVPPSTGGGGAFGLADGAPGPAGRARRSALRTRIAAGTVTLTGAALVGVLLWTLMPTSEGKLTGGATNSGAHRPATTPGASNTSGAPDASDPPNDTLIPSPASVPEAEEMTETNLLTPEGIRKAVGKLRPIMGGSRVTGFVVYPEHVSAEALVKGSTKRYDRFTYRGGDVASRQGAGGTTMSGTVPVDLASFDWDALPALLSKADRVLGVEKPTSRYLVVSTASTVFNSGPSMSIYLSDGYGSGYLKADPSGKVIATHPQEK